MSQEWQDRLGEDLSQAPDHFKKLIEVIAKLRHPQDGCPWDLKQDHRSLRRFMIEEAYEAAEAMAGDDFDHLREELGDVLLQVVLNSQLLRDSGEEGITSVIESITDKMVRRHPHVFDESSGKLTEDEVKANWQKIKSEEKPDSVEHTFANEEKETFPALMQAYKIGKRAEKVRFDWADAEQVWQQLSSELEELRIEIDRGNQQAIVDEMGDVFFSLAQLCRHLKVDPEVAASQGNQKFLRRFRVIDGLVQAQGKSLSDLDLEEMEEFWKRAKQIDRNR
ncbi:nucleoside triphosphate pyrophosphohydrolase [Pseudobacteriovorax antillogorgiicola]|uniref:ATP diphosphatase n=1 Tax=Pseudobacteriovorax antillogorgiicola TaxID=1513793 RepID=A0A1Y6B5C5_9BACT|nr:nucleoside triphosphate pyrophosphohydrolase [Pseudobacteriovorax antillogorgiicola]TCS59408.1 ATP diphosphatase [Pseudobacteriovorax antillogorgiicola]SME88595.1 ATP diphosphatase [Pseudobacteriovorax antillogorgiicola]